MADYPDSAGEMAERVSDHWELAEAALQPLYDERDALRERVAELEAALELAEKDLSALMRTSRDQHSDAVATFQQGGWIDD